MGKSNKKGPKGNVFKVAGAKSLKKSKAKAVNLGLKNAEIRTTAHLSPKYHREPSIRRPYIDYSKAQLEACLAAVRAKELTQRDASYYYKIPCSTIKYKLANKSNKNPGRQPTFTEQEEELFVEHISTLSKYGFPFTHLSIRMVIRDYLNSRKRTVNIFRKNIPGKDWLKTFLERHKTLYRPYVVNTKPHVSEATIQDFIEHVSKETEDIHPANIYGYDEISFSDDALKSTVVWRRNTKYPEINSNAIEAGFTVMFCGNAEGEAIPPFIISKSEHHCSTWAENGPDGAYYNSTKYGWIDVVTFEKWFFRHLLPIFKKSKGPKVLIGDNIYSHISIKVLSECKKNDIRFICLPPNAINVLHPLEIAYYQPLQQIWREVLLTWKIVKVESNTATTLKADFPCLLKSALDLLTDLEQNLIQGFEETGICPLDIQEPLTKLNKIRILNAKKRKLEKREYYSEQIASDLADEGSYSWQFEAQKGTNNLNLQYDDDVTSDRDMEVSPEPSNDVCLVVVDNDDIVLIQFQQSNSAKNPLKVTMGDHVIVSRGSCNYPGKVLCTGEVGAFVHCMKRKSFLWTWPAITNTRFFEWEKVLCKIDAPKAVKKGYFSVPELV